MTVEPEASLRPVERFHRLCEVVVARLPFGLDSVVAPTFLGFVVLNSFTFAVFLSNLATGRLAGLLDKMSGPAFWTLHAALVAIAGVLLLALGWVFRKTLAPRSAPA